MNPLAIALNAPLPPSQTAHTACVLDPFIVSFVGVSNVVDTVPVHTFETAFQDAGKTFGKYISNRELVRISRASRRLHKTIYETILPAKWFGENLALHQLGDKLACFIKQEAQFCNSFQDTPLTFKRVPYDQKRHRAFDNDSVQPFGRRQSFSQWTDSTAKTDGNTIQIMRRDGAHIERTLDPLAISPNILPAFSPDGRICAALSGQEPPLLHLWRLDSADVWQTIDCPVLPLNCHCTHLRVNDSAAVFMIDSGTQPNFMKSLHCWEPDAGRHAVYPLNARLANINAVAPDGKHLLLWLDARPVLLMLCALENCKFFILPAPDYSRGCFSPDSDLLVLDRAREDVTMFLNLTELSQMPIEKRHLRTFNMGDTSKVTRLAFAADGKSIVRQFFFHANQPFPEEFCFPFRSSQAQLARALALAASNTAASADAADQHPVKYGRKLGIVPGQRFQAQDRWSPPTWTPPPLQKIVNLAQQLDPNHAEERRIAEQVEEIQRIVEQEPAIQHQKQLSKPIEAIRRASGSNILREMAQAADQAYN